MTEPAEPAGPGEQPEPAVDIDEWQRMHPLSPLLKGGIALLVIAGIIIANFRDHFLGIFVGDRFGGSDDFENYPEASDPVDLIADRGLILIVLAGVLGVVALIVLFSWIAWKFSTYRITQDAVEAKHGVLFRSHRRAPLERIQSVNLQRQLLARALGLTKIEIVTAGQGGKVEFAYLNYQHAKTVRQQILAAAAVKRGGGVVSVAPAQASGVRPESDQLGSAQLNAAPLGSAQLEAGQLQSTQPEAHQPSVFDANLTARVNDFADADIDPKAITENTLVRVPVPRLIASIALSWEMVTLIVIAAAVIVGAAAIDIAILLGILPLGVVMVGVMIGQFNKGFNFTLSRGEDTVRTGAGLTSTLTETIPFGRVHAVEARQPLMWRGLGWWKVRITTAGHSIAQAGQNASQNVVLPVGTVEDVLRVFKTLLPGNDDDIEAAEQLKDGLAGTATSYLSAGPKAGWVLWFARRRAGITIANADQQHATLRVRRGFLTRSLGVMPVVRAQSVMLHRPLVHRMLGLASLQAHTVLGPVVMKISGVELKQARTLFDQLESCVLRVQSHESAEKAKHVSSK